MLSQHKCLEIISHFLYYLKKNNTGWSSSSWCILKCLCLNTEIQMFGNRWWTLCCSDILQHDRQINVSWTSQEASEAGKYWFITFPLLHWRKLGNPKRRQLKGFVHNPLILVARVNQCYGPKFWWELQILSSLGKTAVPFLKLEI